MSKGIRFSSMPAAVIVCTAALSDPSWAGSADSLLVDDANGRYALAPLEGGVVKLDTRTGAVTECRHKGDALSCALAEDERQKMQDEIDRLTRDNVQLRAKLDTAQAGGVAKPAPSLPSDEEVDRALSLMERFLRRFKAIVREDDKGTAL
jgi:hypothetical protein